MSGVESEDDPSLWTKSPFYQTEGLQLASLCTREGVSGVTKGRMCSHSNAFTHSLTHLYTLTDTHPYRHRHTLTLSHIHPHTQMLKHA